MTTAGHGPGVSSVPILPRMEQRGRSRRSRGVALVEFAFVCVLLFTLIFGIISYAYMMSFRQAISQGAAEGARAGAVTPAAFTVTQKETAARNALNEALDSYSISCSGTTLLRDGSNVGTCGVTVATCTNNTSRSCVSVAVDYHYNDHPLLPAFPGFGIVMPDHLAYTAVAEVS